MKVVRGIANAVKPLVNVPAWIGYRQLANNAKSIKDLFISLFVPVKPASSESFEEALKRLNLTETTLNVRAKEFKRLFIIFVLGGLLLVGYSIYLLWAHALHASFACLGLAFILFVYSFRYHFWLFQIRQRKLGCTFREWLDSGFMGEK